MPTRSRKPGRPKLPANQTRDIRFEIRLSLLEVAKIKRVAPRGKLSTWMRDVVLGVADSLNK